MTAILERASGTETPAATKVSPITVSGIPRVLPGIEKIYNFLFIFIFLSIKENCIISVICICSKNSKKT